MTEDQGGAETLMQFAHRICAEYRRANWTGRGRCDLR